MITKGLFVRLEAKPGSEAKLKSVLMDALPLAEAEQETPVWFAVQFGPSNFGLFDAFRNEDGRNAHMNGEMPPALRAQAAELLASAPVTEKLDVIAAKS